MKVIFAAGGTGGHIYPAIAVANELLRRDPSSEILFVGTARGIETRIVPDSGFQLAVISSLGLKNVGVSGKIKGMAVLPKSFIEALRLIADFNPDVTVGAGGYVSGPVLLTSKILGKKTLVMDSNALPGFTNRQLARFVDRAALTFEDSLPYFGSKGIVTGNPVRKEFFSIPTRDSGDVLNILIFGGSQGARAINQAMTAALPELQKSGKAFAITHQTGESDLETVTNAYTAAGWENADIRPYISDMVSAFETADLIICRAGATTCAEVAASGKASIMVPLPTAADDHQRINAEALKKNGAARMILQKDLDGATLAEQILHLADDRQELSVIGSAARKMSHDNAAESVADMIEELAGRR